MKRNIKKIIGNIYYHSYFKFRNYLGNRILIYHSIGSKIKNDNYGFSVSKKLFIEQINYLKDNFLFTHVDEKIESKLEKDTLSITFDDGFDDNLIAFEYLEKYSIPYNLYITTNFIGQKLYLKKNQVKYISKFQNCKIGLHGHTHKPMSKMNFKEQEDEITKGKKILEDLIGMKIVHFAYPHGSYNDESTLLLKKNKFKTAVSSRVGLNRLNKLDLLKLRRNEIIGSDNITELKKKIDGYYDYIGVRRYSAVKFY